MKFAGYLIEDTKFSKEKIEKIIDRDCTKFIKEMRGEYGLLFRGSHRPLKDIQRIKHRKDRSPKDTPQELHDFLNKIFEEKFGWPVRSGIFAVAHRGTASGYGEAFNFFPIGDYKYVYSTKITDLYQELDDINITSYFNDDYMEASRDKYIDDTYDDIINHIHFRNGKGMRFKTESGRSIINIKKYMEVIKKQNNIPSIGWIDLVPGYSSDWLFVVWDKKNNIKIDKIYLVDWDELVSFKGYKDNIFKIAREKETIKEVNKIIKTYKTTGLYKLATELSTGSAHEISFWCDYYYLVDERVFSLYGDEDENW